MDARVLQTKFDNAIAFFVSVGDADSPRLGFNRLLAMGGKTDEIIISRKSQINNTELDAWTEGLTTGVTLYPLDKAGVVGEGMSLGMCTILGVIRNPPDYHRKDIRGESVRIKLPSTDG